MKNLLWLDDQRNPYINDENKVPLDSGKHYNINWVINYEQFVQWIEKFGLPNAISFDHDLHEEHYTPEYLWDNYEDSKKFQEHAKKSYTKPTGEDCAKWLFEYCRKHEKKLPNIYIHTANPVGADWIEEALGEAYATIEWGGTVEYWTKDMVDEKDPTLLKVRDAMRMIEAASQKSLDEYMEQIREKTAEVQNEKDIFSHNIIKALEDKGFTRGVKFRTPNELHDVIYDPQEVKFDSEGIHIGGMYIMKHGKWATILDTKDEYTRGQEDMIAKLKDEFTRILDDKNNKGDMLLVEIIRMLRNLKADGETN